MCKQVSIFFTLTVILSFSSKLIYSQQPKNKTNEIYTHQLKEQLKSVKQDTTKLRILKELINITIDIEPQAARSMLQDGLYLANKIHDTTYLTIFYLQELRLFNQQGQFKHTLEHAYKIESLIEKKANPQQRITRFTSIANAMQRLGLYDSAAKTYNKILAICKENQLKSLEVNTLMNIAILFQYQNRIEEMKQLLLNTLIIAQKYQLTDNIAMIRVNLSNAESRLNNFGKAIEYLQEVVPIFINQNNQYALGLVYSNLSWCYYKSEQLNEALNFAKKSYQIRTFLGDASGLAHLNLNISKIFLGTGKYDSANHYAQLSLQKSKQLHLVNDIRDNYETLSKINEQTKNYQAALEYARLFSDWKDSVNNIEKNKLVEQELQKIKIDSVIHLKTAYEILEKSKNKVQYVNLILIISLFVSIIVGIIMYRNLRKRYYDILTLIPLENKTEQNDHLSKLETEKIKEENKELIQHKEELENNLKKQQFADIKGLRELINSDKLHTDSYWSEFFLIFSRLYPDFFGKLKSNYPDLTQHELRICALIKLNHNVLDIAKVLNITVDSARKARYRLYKKMGLTNDQELVDTIIQS